MTQLTFPRPGVTSCHIRWTLWFFLAPMLLWLFLLIVLPHLDLLYMSLQVEDDSGGMAWGLANYGKFFEEPIYWNTFVRTAGYSILVTFITFVVALPVAFYITKVVRPSLTGFLMTLLLPFWVSELVRVYGWMILLRESGIINHFLIRFSLLDHPVEMLYNDATMVIPLISVLESLDDNLIEAAYDLGGNMWTVLFRIIIPHSMTGIMSGSIVVFMLTLGNYLTPNLMGGGRTRSGLPSRSTTSSSPVSIGTRVRPSAFCCCCSPRRLSGWP